MKNAVQKNHGETVKLLLVQQSDLDLDRKFRAMELKATGATLLHVAAAFGSTTLLEYLLAAGADPHRVTDDGRTPLHCSSFDTTGSNATALLKVGSRLNDFDSQRWTAWHFASAHCNYKMLKALADFDNRTGMSITASSLCGETPLHVFGACSSKQGPQELDLNLDKTNKSDLEDIQALEFIVELGADPCVLLDDGTTVLHHWISQSYLSTTSIEWLLSKGVARSKVCKNGKTALHLLTPPEAFDVAILKKYIQLLLPDAHDATTSKKERFPIHELCRSLSRMHFPALDAYVALGANPMAEDEQGKTCFEVTLDTLEYEINGPDPTWALVDKAMEFLIHIASSTDDLKLSSLLEHSGRVFNYFCRVGNDRLTIEVLGKFDVDQCDTVSNRTGLQNACYFSSSSYIISKMLDCSKHNSPYHGLELLVCVCAGVSASIDNALLLLNRGVDINEVSSKAQSTPLIIAAIYNKTDLVTFLLDQGADPNPIDWEGQNALHHACRLGHETVVQVLLANLNQDPISLEPASAKTPLDDIHNPCADDIATDDPETAKEDQKQPLLCGLDINARCRSGYTALDCAASAGHIKIMERLLACGADMGLGTSGGSMALFIAARDGNEKMVDLLLSYDRDVVLADTKNTMSPYLAALKGGHENLAKKLLDYTLKKCK